MSTRVPNPTRKDVNASYGACLRVEEVKEELVGCIFSIVLAERMMAYNAAE